MLITARNARQYAPRIEERDSQRSKLYKAENEIRDLRIRLETVEEMEAYVNKIRSRKVLQDRFKLAIAREITVGDGRARRRAGGDRWGIYMPKWSRSDQIVLHEVAHTITQRLIGNRAADHGWQYANIYLQLVSSMMGREAHDRLKASFKKHGVRFNPKKKRTVTPQMLEHLAKARELAKSV